MYKIDFENQILVIFDLTKVLKSPQVINQKVFYVINFFDNNLNMVDCEAV